MVGKVLSSRTHVFKTKQSNNNHDNTNHMLESQPVGYSKLVELRACVAASQPCLL